jgi:hypothetical protein
VVGVAGEVAWLALGLPGVHRTSRNVPVTTSGKVPVASSATSLTDRSETVSESYTDFTWTPVHWAPSFILALAGLVAGFSWEYRRHRARTHRGQPGEDP